MIILPSVDKCRRGFAGREAPLTVLSSLLYGSKAASSALSGTLPASEKLLRTPELQKGRDGKAAGRRHAAAFRARERSQHVPFEALGRVCPCQPRVPCCEKGKHSKIYFASFLTSAAKPDTWR